MFEHLNTPEEIFRFKLGSALTMERTLIDVLEELEQHAQREQIKAALRHHREQTLDHVANVERCFNLLGEGLDDSPCPVVDALEKDGKSTIGKADESVVDAVVLAAATESEHYEIGVYETLIANARARGETEVTELLQRNLDDERHALELALNTMAQMAAQGVAL
ncbi:MAG: ferritin-like domain-containing protein [Solirubrobacteraceae bacterium]